MVTGRILPRFSAAAFERIATVRSQDPRVFVGLDRSGRRGRENGFARCRDFGEACRSACLIDRNSPVLMVAHVDTVLMPGKKAAICGNRLYHNAVDNRLGVYLGMELLPSLGIGVDLLLTTGEEEGYSTAAVFRTRKRYHWMFSFDRKGEDVVLYQYERPSLVATLREAGFTVGQGSYSCIAELENLGCCGMNFGCGMYDYHSEGAYCDLAALVRQLRRFSAFFRKYSATLLPHSASLGVGVDSFL